MGCEMAAAVGSATVHGGVFFGQNIHHLSPYQLLLSRNPGEAHVPGEMVQIGHAELLQVAHTHAVLGCRSEPMWGFQHGLNEHGLAVGCTTWRCKIDGDDAGLTGPDLVRLTLERAQHVERGLDVLTDLLRHFGQSATNSDAAGHVFFLADSQSAYVVEAAGPFWAASQIRHVRAACDAALIRQDWQLISHGLADFAVEKGWRTHDGAKLDFAGTLQPNSDDVKTSLKRWGRAAFLLEQNNGNIDVSVVRRILSDHFDGTPSEIDPMQPAAEPQSICRHASDDRREQTVASVTAELLADGDQLPILWCCIGPPCLGVSMPFFPCADLPEGFDKITDRVFAAIGKLRLSENDWMKWRNRMEALQGRIQQQTDEFLAETNRATEQEEASRQCELFTQNHLEQLEIELDLLDNEWTPSSQSVVGSSE